MNELSRHIEILLLDNDCVIIPGFGGFMAHHKPAEYDAEQETFYPPIRTLGFNPQLTLNDSLLAQAYTQAYDISYPEANRRLEAEVEEIKQNIDIEGSYTFQGIGVVSKTADGRYTFEPSVSGLLTPSLYALNTCKLSQIATIAKPASLKETEEDTKEEYDYDYDDEDSWLHINLKKLWYAAAAALMFLLLPFAFSSLPLGKGSSDAIQCSIGDTSKKVGEKLKDKYDEIVNTENTDSKDTKQTTATVVEEKEAAPQEVIEKKKTEKPQEYYSIILASKVSRNGAEKYLNTLKEAGFQEGVIYESGSMRRIIYGSYATESEASQALRELRRKDNRFDNSWVQKLKAKS